MLFNALIRILLLLLTALFVSGNLTLAQLPSPALIGYWHNWNDNNAPYIHLDSVDSRYNVIEVAFAVPTSPTNMTMLFTPEVVSQSVFITKIQTLQSQGKKVLLSIGGANASIDLTTAANKSAFISSMTALINTYGFDGIDIDIENGNSILITGGTIAAPANGAQINLIDAIKQVMAAYRSAHGKKMLLTMAPETAYVQGGQSGFGSIWGGYLPIIHALRDSLDVLQVQLYNSGTMYGIDGNIYTQGTADFIVAMAEAVIDGFTTAGGVFAGLPASKVAVGLPACPSAAGGGFVDSATVRAAMKYLRGNGSRPGSYSLKNAGGYAALRGMMTWSVNWDAVSACAGRYQYANNYAGLFGAGNPPAAAGAITGLPSVCQGQNSVVYSVAAIANAAAYVWTLPAGANGLSSTNSITVNYGAAAVSGNISVAGANAYGTGAPSTLSVTVNPLPVVSFSTQQSMVCHNSPPVALSGGQPAGGVYSGVGVNNGMFDPSAVGTGNAIVFYSYTNANGCTNRDSAVLTVISPPAVVFELPAGIKLCQNSAPITLSGGMPAGGTYTGAGVDNGVFNPAVPGAGDVTITYSYTDGYGCSAADSAVLTVLPAPQVSYRPLVRHLCINSSAVALSGGSPAGGKYSGKGVSNGIFSPAAAGEGTWTITYSYTDGYGCSAADSAVLTVLPAPQVSYRPLVRHLCINSAAVALSGGSPAGGKYSGKGVSNGIFSPAAAGEGTWTIIYSYTDGYGCSAADSAVIWVNSPTSATLNETATGSFSLNGKTYTQSGTYTQVLKNAKGCDSVITLNLTIAASGTDEPPHIAILRVYPSPANGTFTLETAAPGSSEREFVLYSAAGAAVFSAAMPAVKTDFTPNLPPGVYLCILKERNRIVAAERLILH